MADVVVVEDEIGMPTKQIFQAALDDFKATLTDSHRELFSGKDLNHVKLKIVGIQHHQERVKGMMNFSRIKYYLDRFAEFDSVCRDAKIAGENSAELSSFIWGPSAHILQVSQEDPAILNVVLDAYQKFGKRIPEMSPYRDLIKDQSDMIKCIAFMYQDLLQFYREILKRLNGRGEMDSRPQYRWFHR